MGIRHREAGLTSWQRLLVPAEAALGPIRPGMRIFLSTGVAEPRAFVRALKDGVGANLTDLELIQLVSFSGGVPAPDQIARKCRLKTFFPSGAVDRQLAEGTADLIPSRFARIAPLFESGRIAIDMAVLQITPPDESGYCSLGVALDVGRIAMAQADVVVGEINALIPRTLGDTLVHISEFDLLIEGFDPPFYIERPLVEAVYETLGANLAALIDDGTCIAFSFGPLYEVLAVQLAERRNLGIHSPFFTDALMDLIKSGAVSNRNKGVFHGRAVAAYALGTPGLLAWLDRNPLVEFQTIDRVCNPAAIGGNPNFTAIFPAQAADLQGQVLLAVDDSRFGTGAAEVYDFCSGAEISPQGRTLFALPSRNARGQPNIVASLAQQPSPFGSKGAVDLVVTEYGAADLSGRSVRERAQAMIDVAHPDDRDDLIRAAKAQRIIYPDQIYLSASGKLYPADIHVRTTLKSGARVRYRPIRPSDEEGMRRLFYRFSDEAVYYRYFTPLRSMPHDRMQAYVNVDWTHTMALVGLVGPLGQGRIIAEARYIRELRRPLADLVFVVDPEYQGQGIASYLYRLLADLARQRGIKGFTAEVLFSNQAMMKVFRNGGHPIEACLEHGIYYLTIPFEKQYLSKVRSNAAN